MSVLVPAVTSDAHVDDQSDHEGKESDDCEGQAKLADRLGQRLQLELQRRLWVRAVYFGL